MPRPARRCRGGARQGLQGRRRTTTSCSRRRNSTRSRWRARTRSRSKPSCRAQRGRRNLSRRIVSISCRTTRSALEAFAVIREAMTKKDLVGLARVVLYRRERLLMLQPRGKGIVGTRCATRPRCATRTTISTTSRAPRCSKDMLQLAEHILDTKKHEIRPVEVRGSLRGCAQGADQGQAGRQGAAGRAEPKPSNVINLMDALRRSVKGAGGARATGWHKPSARQERQRSGSRRTEARHAKHKTRSRRAS